MSAGNSDWLLFVLLTFALIFLGFIIGVKAVPDCAVHRAAIARATAT